jgi:pilus assembly protein CpaE
MSTTLVPRAAAPGGATTRTVLIAGLAPAPEGAAGAALTRAGYGAPSRVPTLEAAAARLGREKVDLLIVPLDAPPAALEVAARAAQAAGCGVLGAAPRLEAGTLLKGMRAGVQECLVTPFDAEELEGALDRIERRASGGVTAGIAVAVYSAKGGIGTTTTAVNLAHAFARNNPRARVALADLVVSGGDVAVQLDMLPKYDVGTLAGKAGSLDAELLRSVLAERGPREWVLAASERPEVTELVDGSAAGAIVGQLRSDFDFTALDCEHHVSDRSLAALDAADKVILLTQLGLAPLRSAQRSLALFDRLGYPSDRVLVVVNRHQSGDVLTLDDAQEALEHPIAAALPNDFRGCADALAKGQSVVEHAPDAPLARAFLSLAARLGGAEPEAPAPAARLGRLRALFNRPAAQR